MYKCSDYSKLSLTWTIEIELSTGSKYIVPYTATRLEIDETIKIIQNYTPVLTENFFKFGPIYIRLNELIFFKITEGYTHQVTIRSEAT